MTATRIRRSSDTGVRLVLDEHERTLRDSVRALLADQCEVRAVMAGEPGWDQALWQRLIARAKAVLLFWRGPFASSRCWSFWRGWH